MTKTDLIGQLFVWRYVCWYVDMGQKCVSLSLCWTGTMGCLMQFAIKQIANVITFISWREEKFRSFLVLICVARHCYTPSHNWTDQTMVCYANTHMRELLKIFSVLIANELIFTNPMGFSQKFKLLVNFPRIPSPLCWFQGSLVFEKAWGKNWNILSWCLRHF